MAKTLSEDLRSRLIAAVAGGMSRRAAADRFGVAIASAVRWVHVWRPTGVTCAKPKGGDLRSHRIEAVILGAIDAQVDMTLIELADMLRRDHGASFAPSPIWRFLDRHGMTIKKRRTPASRNDPTSPGLVRGPARSRSGASGSHPDCRVTIWSSSMRPARSPRWPACAAVPDGGSAVAPPSRIVKIPEPCASPA